MEPSEEIKQKTEIFVSWGNWTHLTYPKLIRRSQVGFPQRINAVFFLPLHVHDNHFNFNTTNTLKWGYLGATEFINSTFYFLAKVSL